MIPEIIKTTCPYCGVGCGIEATVDDANEHKITIKGDPEHPANFGKLCSKGAALGDTVSLENRLLYPEIHGRQTDWNSALDYVANGFNHIINEFGPDSVAFYVSGQLLTEDYYVANKLMKGFIGSANIDTNSRLCMSSAVAGYMRAFGSDSVPCSYEDLDQAELIVLVGSNTAWCHPIAFQRIRKAKENNPALKIVVIDPRMTATCDIADLYLAIKPGMDAAIFNGLLVFLANSGAIAEDYISEFTDGYEQALREAEITTPDIQHVAERCRLKPEEIQQFYGWFASIEKVVTVYSQGINQSGSGTDKCNAIINCHLATGKIGKPGMGPFSFTGQPNAMGGREVGGLANMLAAHMDLENPMHRDRVKRFWQTDNIAERPGLKAVALFDAIYEGKIKAVWIMATNPVVTLPNANRVIEALKRCELVVVSDCIANTDTLSFAHVKLPATGWSEKDGTVTNLERRISRQRPLFQASGEAKPDWWIISQVAQKMGFQQAFSYQSSAEIFREHAALSGFENSADQDLRDFDISGLAGIDQSAFDNLKPVQWPVNKQYPDGTTRLFADNRYFTCDQKAKFISITPIGPINKPDNQYPFTLNTGRIRDQWHTMTRTGLSTRLNSHYPEPFVEINPEDAKQVGLEDHSLAKIESQWGEMITRVMITSAQQQGSLFAPMHWTLQSSSQGRVGAVVNPVVDPISGQPESKQTPVNIIPFKANWYAMILSRTSLSVTGFDYWVTLKGEGYIRHEIAFNQSSNNWREWSQSLLLPQSNTGCDWIEYIDAKAGYYRAAHFVDQALQSCIFISPNWHLPESGWLATLFSKQSLSRQERLNLLSGQPPQGQQETGKIVCSCFNVGEKTITRAIKNQNLKSVNEVSQYTGAGTGCGSCLAELKTYLTENKESLSI